MRQDIAQHEGKKYLRKIYDATGDRESGIWNLPQPPIKSVMIDVYEVIKSFEVTCPAQQHALKKILCAGKRSKGDTIADLKGVLAAVNRAIDFAERDIPDQKVPVSKTSEENRIMEPSREYGPTRFSVGDIIQIEKPIPNRQYQINEEISVVRDGAVIKGCVSLSLIDSLRIRIDSIAETPELTDAKRRLVDPDYAKNT